MNPPQTPALSQTLGALVMAASKSINEGKHLTQASSTEDAVAEDQSDDSQNTLDMMAYANTSTSAPQLPTEISGVLASCAVAHHFKNGTNPIRIEEGNSRKKDHKKRSKNWSVLETLRLIRARAELDVRFRSSGRKAALWEEIAQALQKADVSRDGQQCKDKWEKPTAGYKEVREGARDKEDLPFYREIHQLFSWKEERKEVSSLLENGVEAYKGGVTDNSTGHAIPNWAGGGPHTVMNAANIQKEEFDHLRKRKRDSDSMSLPDIAIVQELLETILTTQQHLFQDLLEAAEKKEQMREQMRQDREEMWRAEERAERDAFNRTMVILTQRLLEERPVTAAPAPTVLVPIVSNKNGFNSSKKRSKNWKRSEVFQLIRFRKEMEIKFANSSRRAGLWEELGAKLASLGIKRDGKQCREKWDKLMAGYKDVIDGRREEEESPYFTELSIYMDAMKELRKIPPIDASKEEYAEEDNAEKKVVS